MRFRRILLSSLLCGLVAAPALASGWVPSAAASPEESENLWEGLKHQLEQWGGRLRDQFNVLPRREDRPLITFMLDHREKLELSPSQIETLEKLRNDFQRQAIRLDADLKVAEMDLAQLLRADAADMEQVESKVREIEKFKGDLRIARLRAIEAGKSVLTKEQRAKLKELLGDSPYGRSHARISRLPH